jgi:hypothetical protein
MAFSEAAVSLVPIHIELGPIFTKGYSLREEV